MLSLSSYFAVLVPCAIGAGPGRLAGEVCLAAGWYYCLRTGLSRSLGRRQLIQLGSRPTSSAPSMVTSSLVLGM
jgi:hypothetical protein